MDDIHHIVAERLSIKAAQEKKLIDDFIQVDILDAARTLAEALTKLAPADTEVVRIMKLSEDRRYLKEWFGKSSSTEVRLRWLCIKYATFGSVVDAHYEFLHTVALLEGGVIEDHVVGTISLYNRPQSPDGWVSKPSSAETIVTIFHALRLLNQRHRIRETKHLFKKIPSSVLDALMSDSYPTY